MDTTWRGLCAPHYPVLTLGSIAGVDLFGDLCMNAKAGTYDELRFEFGCVALPVLPPPVPPV